MNIKTNTLTKLNALMALLAVTSGVVFTATLVSAQEYYYVNTNGQLELETATTPSEAINEADDIKYNSGVITAEAYMELSQ